MAESIVEEQEDQQFFATVPELFGVWGLGSSISEARDDLQDSVYDWLLLKIEDADQDIPPKGGIDLNRL